MISQEQETPFVCLYKLATACVCVAVLMAATPLISRFTNWIRSIMDEDEQSEFQQSHESSKRVILFEKVQDCFELGKSDFVYNLRLKLPGVPKNYRNLKLHVEIDGTVTLEGGLTDYEIMDQLIQKYYHLEMLEIVAPRHFRISVELPGMLDPRFTKMEFKPDGCLEIMIKRHRVRTSPWAHV